MRSRTLVFLFVAGCFSEPEAPKLKCDDQNPCGSGYVCESMACVPVDMASPQGAEDLSSDLGAVSGCRSGGGSALGGAWACSGTCAAGQCADLCAVGWSVCKRSDSIDQAAADKLGGFFVADVPGYFFPPSRSATSCGGAVATSAAIVFGVGKSGANITDNPAKMCSGFSKSADCGVSPRILSCSSPYSVAQFAIHAAENGVICCKN